MTSSTDLQPPPDSAALDREFTVEARSQRQQVMARFRRNKAAMSGLVVLTALLLLSFVVPFFYPIEPGAFDENSRSVPPGSDGHPLGTQELGQDLLALLMQGVQRTTFIVVLTVSIALVIGLTIGMVAGYYGRWVDNLLMRFVDLILVLPLLVVLLVVASAFPSARTPIGVGIIIGLFGWLDLSRLTRAQFLSLREREFVEAAHAVGARDRRIIFRHLLPNTIGPVIVWATLTAAIAILIEASLTFLGFGVQGNNTSLGRLVSDGVAAAETRPWLFYFPGLTIMVMVMAINLVGDGIRDAFDPSHKQIRA